MPDTAPFSRNLEQLKQNTTSARPSSSPELVEAKGKAETAAVHAAQTAGEAENADLAPMMDWIMTKADLEAQTCFGVAVPDDMVPVELAQVLCNIKADKGLPLETLPDALVGQLLQTELQISARAVAIEAQTETTKASADALQSYKDALASVSDLPNTEKIKLLANDGRVPESERTKLQAFARILAIAETFPEDAPIIEARMNGFDFGSHAPSPIDFIQEGIFSGPDHDSGISTAMQQAVAREFKLTPRRIVTGSDFANAMQETRPDAEGNLVPIYSEDEPLEFGLGITGYPSSNGEQEFMKATPTHGHAITLDVSSLSPAGKGIAASYLGMWKVAEDAGETDFFLSLTQYDIRGQGVLDEVSLNRAARLANYVFGGRTGYNGEILRGSDAVGLMQWQAQLRNLKGDAGQGDRNASDARANLRGLGIMGPNGNINEDVLKVFGDYSHDNWFGAPEYEDVQAYLRRRFPSATVGKAN